MTNGPGAPAGPATLRANIEAIHEGVLSGWYYAGDGSREFRVFADGALIGSGVADRFREDLAAARIGDGAHAFAFALPPQICDGAEHRFGIAHKTDPREVTALVLQAPHLATRAVGRLEQLVEGEARGWVWNPRDPVARLRVVALESGRPVGSATADARRDDLAQAGIGDGGHAFVMKLPQALFQRTEALELTFRSDAPRGGDVFAQVRIPGRPSDSDEGISQSLLAGAARAALRELSPLLYLQAASPSDLANAVFAASPSGATLVAPKPHDLVRLLRPFPGIEFLLSRDWDIEIEFELAAPAVVSIALVEFNLVELFSPMFPLAADLELGRGRHRLAYSLRARRLRARRLDVFERPIFLAIETRSALDLHGLQVRVGRREAASEGMPLHDSEHPHFAKLADLNETLSSAGKRDPDAWALDAAEAALRLECFETASELIERIDVAGRPSEQQLRYLRVFADVAFAAERVDAVRAILRAHWPLVEKDDVLFSAYSACFPAKAELRGFFAALPSGRPNRFWLARHPLSSETLAASLRDDENGQGDLLWASLAHELGAQDYRAAWNRFLRRFGLEPIRSLDLDRGNVLSTLTFEPPAPVDDGPLVSVLMSAYNASETILYAVQSLLRQSYGNFELLICDDASDDDTVAKLGLLRGHPRVRLFRSRSNQGPYNIRNNLLREARGRFVTFQDADDVAHPARLARQAAELARTGRPFTMARWVRVKADGAVVFFRDQQCLRLSLVSLFAEKGAIERFGGFRRALCAADSEFAQRIRAPGLEKIYSEMEEPLLLGLWSAQSLTRRPGFESTENGVRSRARRVYAEWAARRNILGDDLVPDSQVDEANRSLGIFRPDCGIALL